MRDRPPAPPAPRRTPTTAPPSTVVGTYTPTDPAEPYWGRGGYFAAGAPDSDSALPRMDAVFVADEQDLGVPGTQPSIHLDYRLDPASVTLDDVAAVRADLAAFETAVNAAEIQVATGLRDRARRRRGRGRRARPDRADGRRAAGAGLLVRALPARGVADRGARARGGAGQAARVPAAAGGELRPGRGDAAGRGGRPGRDRVGSRGRRGRGAVAALPGRARRGAVAGRGRRGGRCPGRVPARTGGERAARWRCPCWPCCGACRSGRHGAPEPPRPAWSPWPRPRSWPR